MNDDSSGCPGTNREGEPCGHPEGWGVDGKSTGPCKHHGGAGGNVGDPGGAPEGSANALKHGATADPFNLYENMSDEEQAWVDKRVTAYLEESAIPEDSPKVERVELAVIMMAMERGGRAELLSENLVTTSVVGQTEAGQPIRDEKEHHLNRVVSQLNTDIRMTLKDLDLFGPEKHEHEVTHSGEIDGGDVTINHVSAEDILGEDEAVETGSTTE